MEGALVCLEDQHFFWCFLIWYVLSSFLALSVFIFSSVEIGKPQAKSVQERKIFRNTANTNKVHPNNKKEGQKLIETP